MSHEYKDRIARIPPPPPPVPVNVPPVHDDAHIGHARPQSPSLQASDNFNVIYSDYQPKDARPYSNGDGNEDAARELEESVLGPPSKHKGKGKENNKRPPSRALSESSSDLEVPSVARNGHAHKKRKVDRDATDIADELERSVVDEPIGSISAPPTHKLLSDAKGKGRGKGKGKQREQSVESGSAPVRQRKKPGPRKKLDTLPPQTQELLGVPSASASVAGDMTPVGSRPASPALTSVSATLYELDDTIPPLKRAKKIDDAAMMKRVKTLEEAQRKVWMSIARRDVAKVGSADSITIFVALLTREIGV